MNTTPPWKQSLASKQPSRWGGECTLSFCPFHWQHEAQCDAESFVITDEDFQKRAPCKLAPNNPLELPEHE